MNGFWDFMTHGGFLLLTLALIIAAQTLNVLTLRRQDRAAHLSDTERAGDAG